MDTPIDYLKAAVAAAGGQNALAQRITELGQPVRQGHVWNWLNVKKGMVPPYIAPLVEQATAIACEKLRPDLRWERGKDGRVVAYSTPVQQPSESV